MPISTHTIYANLRNIDQVDSATGALYRELAQDVLADGSVSLGRRLAIATQLYEANRLLGLRSAGAEDSY